jgi:hypothetical protein
MGSLRLDCESIESTYASLETILGVKENALRLLFDSIKVYGEKDCRPSYSDFLLSFIQEKKGCNTCFEQTCWFHATRTWPDNNYDEGILPTKDAIPKILKWLNRDTSQSIRQCNLTDDMVVNKCHNGGPYGFLIKDFAWVENDTYVQYFKCPEIVKDLGLEKIYTEKTVPRIVKFVNQHTPIEALSMALLYVYHNHCNLKIDYKGELAYSFDGKNIPVLKENICWPLRGEFSEAGSFGYVKGGEFFPA